MEIPSLKTRNRENLGKGASKQYRAKELVPSVIYGSEQDTIHILVPELEITNILRSSGEHTLIQVEIDTDEPILTLVSEVQHHPVTDRILHIDFKTVKRGQLIEVPVPIEFVGEAKGAQEGGMFMASVHELTIRAIPMNIPSHITVDITELEEDSAMHISDIVVDEGIEIVDDPDMTVASIIQPRIVVEEVEEEEELDVEGLEEGETPEGKETAEAASAEKTTDEKA